MSSFKKVVLVGASGNIGRPILKALLDSGYDVTIMTRADSSSTFEGVPSENVIKGEYTLDFYRKAFSGQDALVMAIGSQTLEAQKEMIDAAIEVGVNRILPSEFGGDLDDPAALKALPFNQPKKEIADYLAETVKSHPKTTYTTVTSGPFFDWSLSMGFFGIDAKNHKVTLYDEGKTRFDVTKLSTVGKAVANILARPEKYQNERIYIAGMTINQLDILEAFKKATGVQEWEIEHGSAGQIRGEGFEKLSKGDFSGIIAVIDASLVEAGNGSEFSKHRKLENEQLGVKDDLQTTVQAYVDNM